MRYLYLIALAGFIISCQKPQEPEFIAVKNVEITSFIGTTVEVEGNLVYHNPNPISGTLTQLNVEVYANDIAISVIDKEYNQEIKANSEFVIPLTVKFELGDLIQQDNILGGILNAVTQNSVDMKYSGSAKIRIANIPFTIPFDYQEEVDLLR